MQCPIFLPKLDTVILLVQNCRNCVILKRHRDGVKRIPKTLTESPYPQTYYRKHYENIPNNDKDNSDRHSICNCEDFAR